MSPVEVNRNSKVIIAVIIVVVIVLVIDPPYRARMIVAFIGMLIGNQIGLLLDDISKKFRIIGIIIAIWNSLEYLSSGGLVIPKGIGIETAAFLWGFSFLNIFPQRELSVFRIR